MNTYIISYVWSVSQHKNSTKNAESKSIRAVSAQDAAYILTVNLSAGKNVFYTILHIETIEGGN